MRLTKAQINQIRDIIDKHMGVITKLTVGDGKPSPALLKKLGIPVEFNDLISDSYKYGKLSILLGKDLSKYSSQDINNLLNTVILTKNQQHAIDYLQLKTQINIDTLQQKLVSGVVNMAINDQLNMYQTIGKVIPKAMKENLDRGKVIQNLRETSMDWSRDWHRVAQTEMWDAKCMGEANAIIDGSSPYSSKGSETLVFKRPGPNACIKCKQLYLEKDGITPRVFKLSELMANGTNYGKKTADWKATVGTLHPNCVCVLSVMPPGYTFDNTGAMVRKPKQGG